MRSIFSTLPRLRALALRAARPHRALGPKSGHGNCVRIRKKIVSRPPPVGATLVVGGNGHAPVFRVSSPESACRPPFRLLSATEQRRCGAAVPGPRPGLESAPEHQVSSVASKGFPRRSISCAGPQGGTLPPTVVTLFGGRRSPVTGECPPPAESEELPLSRACRGGGGVRQITGLARRRTAAGDRKVRI